MSQPTHSVFFHSVFEKVFLHCQSDGVSLHDEDDHGNGERQRPQEVRDHPEEDHSVGGRGGVLLLVPAGDHEGVDGQGHVPGQEEHLKIHFRLLILSTLGFLLGTVKFILFLFLFLLFLPH